MNKRNKPSDRKNSGKRVTSKDSSRSNSDRSDSDRGTRNRTHDDDFSRSAKKEPKDRPYSGPKRSAPENGGSRYGDKKKPFGTSKRFDKDRDKKDKPYSERKKSVSGPRKFEDKRDRENRHDDRKKPFNRPGRFEKTDDDRRSPERKNSFDAPKRFVKNEDRPDRDDRKSYSGPKKRDRDKSDKRSNSDKAGKKRSFEKPRSKEHNDRKEPVEKKRPRTRQFIEKDQELIGNWRNDRPADSEIREERKRKEVQTITEETRLNKFLANSGLCSRRDADQHIENGAVSINGVIVKELGVKVMPGDEVRFKGRLILPEKPVYILMNKPKDCITSSDDPEGRRTVLDIIGDSVEERIFPVGRLDRNTTGVLLLTNDGDLAQKLTHPSFGVHKIYKADLDKSMHADDIERLKAGIELEDGFIQPDEVAYVDETKKVIGIEIHSGKNHIVHRMFNSLGYMVEKLDRVSFAGLSKDGLKRGEIRHLSEKELLTLRKSTGKQKS